MLLELPPYLEQGLAIAAGEVVGPPGPLLAQCLAPYLRQDFPNLLHFKPIIYIEYLINFTHTHSFV